MKQVFSYTDPKRPAVGTNGVLTVAQSEKGDAVTFVVGAPASTVGAQAIEVPREVAVKAAQAILLAAGEQGAHAATE